MTEDKVLVLTVGTGNEENREKTLFTPLEKSIKDGNWRKVVLLPSTETENLAGELKKRFPGLQFCIKCLPEPRMEDNADACFGHFDKVLGDLLAEVEVDAIAADFTRGTKAMSAALVLAAVGRGVPRLRYITGKRDGSGTVIPDTEQIENMSPMIATARRRLDDTRNLMRHGDFAAASEFLEPVRDLSGPYAKILHEEATGLGRQAGFYSAWDRLDYAEANRLAGETGKEDGLDAAVSWVRRLACAPERCDHEGMARWLRAVTFDLLENGRRRIRDRHFEDALLRGYRVLELIGQFALFGHGIDSASIDPEAEAVRSLRKKLKKDSHDFGTNRKDGRLDAGQYLAARLLGRMGDPRGGELVKFAEKHGEIKPTKRNRSILIHGFETAASGDLERLGESLESLYDALEALLRKHEPCAGDMIEQARLLSFRG